MGAEKPVEVPMTSLSPEALRGVIEEFVTRDGTDYGQRERALDEKIHDVERQLRRREVKLVFDAGSGSVNVVSTRDFPG